MSRVITGGAKAITEGITSVRDAAQSRGTILPSTRTVWLQ